jgi:hypothetical protein
MRRIVLAPRGAGIRDAPAGAGGFLRIRVAREQNPCVHGSAGLRMLRLANPLVRGVLGSRAHALLSGQLLVLAYRGRRSGREYRIPLRYAHVSARGLAAIALEPARKDWWRSFEAPHPATLLLRGERLDVTGMLAEGDERLHALAAYGARFRSGRRSTERAAVVVFERRDG